MVKAIGSQPSNDSITNLEAQVKRFLEVESLLEKPSKYGCAPTPSSESTNALKLSCEAWCKQNNSKKDKDGKATIAFMLE